MECLFVMSISTLSRISRDDLDRCCMRLLRRGRGTRPELRLLEIDGRRVVTKDYAACWPLFRVVVGRWLAAKESANYRRLAGISGIPEWIGVVDPYCFAVGYIEGQSCGEMSPGDLGDPGFFLRLHDLVERLHGAGLVHCDLRYRSNILVSPTGEPYVIDLVAAFPRRGCFGTIRRWLFRLFSDADFQAIAKLKAELSPELLTRADLELLSRVRPIERLARAARAVLCVLFGIFVPRTARRRIGRPRKFEQYRGRWRLQTRQERVRLARTQQRTRSAAASREQHS